MLLADRIPDPGDAGGFVRQVYALSATLGNGPTVAALAIAAYLVGLLGVTCAQGLSDAVIALQGYLQWQRRAQRARRACEQDLLVAVAKAEQVADAPAKKDAQQTVERHGATLAEFARSRRAAGLLYRRTAPVVAHVRSREPRRHHQLAEIAAENAWTTGVEAELARLNLRPNHLSAAHTNPDNAFVYVDQLIGQDLGVDPLDALRALDDGLYQALDRERAEREFRIGVMPPLFAVSLYLAMTLPAALLGTALALWTFGRATVQGSEQSARILSQIILKGLPLPSLRAAEAAGRSSVREGIRELERAAHRAERPAQS